MTKGLEAYKKFCDDVIASVNSGGIHYIDIRNKEIIEKELKRLDEYDNTEYSALIESHKKLLKEKKANKNKLKALEIIKSKEINIHALLLHLKRFDSPDGYNVFVGVKYKITQEEFDLLKEVLYA